jgi:lipopolysaccharide export system permease protein
MKVPIYWRYASLHYWRTFGLAVGTFIAVLLVFRFKDMARFAALSSDWLKTGLFAVYQIPSILPMAIPLSALLAAILFCQSLSRSRELTALRASGLSIYNLVTPLICGSFVLCLANFVICAELAPFCRREGKALLYRETSENPLLLLQRQQLVKLRDVYLQMEVEKEGRKARDFVLIAHNDSNERLTLLTARELKMKSDRLIGTDFAILSHLPTDKGSGFDPLILENQAEMTMDAPLLSTALKKNRPRIDPSALNLRMLQFRLSEGPKNRISVLIEILRRFSLVLAPLSFTLLGAIFAIEPGRQRKTRGLAYASLLTLTVLMSYLLGKGLKFEPLYATGAFLLPHLLIWISVIHRQSRLNRGVI